MRKILLSLLIFQAVIEAFMGYIILSHSLDSEDVMVCMGIGVSAFIFVILAASISIWYLPSSANLITREP